MKVLAVLMTHLDPQGVAVSVANLRAGMPGSPVVVVHGGRREDFDALEGVPKLFTDDPGLRGAPAALQSYDDALGQVWAEVVAGDPTITHVLLVEFDQVLVAADFGHRLQGVIARSGADVLGKGCVDRTGTNWWHRIRYQHDPAFLAFLRELSVREDPTRIWGVLGTGFVLSREALGAFCALEHPAGIYNELYIPTVLHHLGFRLEDVDRVDPLYAHVRWTPPYSLGEVEALRGAGAAVVHPFKAIESVAGLLPERG